MGAQLGAPPAHSGNTGFQNAPGYPGGPSDIAGASLTDGSSITIASNTTYSYYKNLTYNLTGEIGSPSVPVHNVTFTGCLWETNGPSSAGLLLCADGPLTFQYCTVRGLVTTPPCSQANGYQYGCVADGTQAFPGTFNTFAQQVTFSNCDFWGFANGTKMAGSTATWPLLYDTCWFHDLRANDNGLDHQDGPGCPQAVAGTEGGSSITFNKCTVEALGDTQGLAFQGTGATWSDMTITNNLFGGFGNFINLAGPAAGGGTRTNITVTDNTWSTRLQCTDSPLYDAYWPAANGLWRRNKWYVPAGAFYGNPAYNGYYWLPASVNFASYNSSTNDELAMGLVSTTDYTG
jgi:hypothetical protein